MSVAGGPWLWDGGGVQLQQQRLQTGQPCQPTRPPSTTTTTSSSTQYSQCRRLAQMPRHGRVPSANVPYGLALTINTCSLAYQLCAGCKHVWLLCGENGGPSVIKIMTGVSFFAFTQSAVHTDKLRPGLDGMSCAGKNGREKRLYWELSGGRRSGE